MAKEVVVAAFKSIQAEAWLKIIIGALSAAVFLGIVYANNLTVGQQALANHEAIQELSSCYAEQRVQLQSVSRSLAKTERGLTLIVERMNDHDIQDSRREAEIRHNKGEINRLRDDGQH